MEDGLRLVAEQGDVDEESVLILVVMEDGLRPNQIVFNDLIHVLILVVMEDGLRQIFGMSKRDFNIKVLILVVMEDGLRLSIQFFRMIHISLNPCCNGRWSPTHFLQGKAITKVSLNPCCNGRWSPTLNPHDLHL